MDRFYGIDLSKGVLVGAVVLAAYHYVGHMVFHYDATQMTAAIVVGYVLVRSFIDAGKK